MFAVKVQVRINKTDDFGAKFAKKYANFHNNKISWFYLLAHGLGFPKLYECHSHDQQLNILRKK